MPWPSFSPSPPSLSPLAAINFAGIARALGDIHTLEDEITLYDVINGQLPDRAFWLFVLCALLPITVLAVISLRNVSAQLREQNARELHQITRGEAIGIYERLSFLDANLRLAALTLRNPARKSPPVCSDLLNQQFPGLEALLEGLQVVTPGGRHRYIFGNSPPLVRYTTDEQLFLHWGQNALSVLPCGKPDRCILLSQVLNKDYPAGGILVGEIRSADLWSGIQRTSPNPCRFVASILRHGPVVFRARPRSAFPQLS